MYSRALATAFVVIAYVTTATSIVRNLPLFATALNDWIAEGADIIFVKFSKESSPIHRFKLIISKYIIWTWNARGLPEIVRRNRILNKPMVLFELLPSRYVKSVVEYFRFTNDTGALTHWVLVLNKKDFDSQAHTLHESASRFDVSALSIDEKKFRTFFRCRKGFTRNRCSQNAPFVSSHYKIGRSDSDIFSGQTIRIACVILGEYDSCNRKDYAQVMTLLSQKNASVTLVTYRNFKALYSDIYLDKIDLGLVKSILREDSLASLSFADMTFSYGTFYALDNKTRVVSLFNALGSSQCGLLALLSLICCAFTAAVSRKPRMLLVEYLLGVLDDVCFLLAPLLGTSSKLPIIKRTACTSTFVYSVWLLAILPFSVYFRSELMSLVMVPRPANILDTLGELESGLDAGTVLPCVREWSIEHADLDRISNEGSVLLKKLRAAYRNHKRDGLLKTFNNDCFRCATQENRVCFINRHEICVVKNAFSEIGEFREHLTMDLSVLPMPKESKLTGPFKRFMDSVSAGSLLQGTSLGCYRHIPIREITDDLFPFLANWLALLSTSGIVLIVEVFVAHFSNRP